MAGIRRLVAFQPDTTDSQWGEQFAAALELFNEAGTSLEFIEPNAPSTIQMPGT